jgi:hypothetical protein
MTVSSQSLAYRPGYTGNRNLSLKSITGGRPSRRAWKFLKIRILHFFFSCDFLLSFDTVASSPCRLLVRHVVRICHGQRLKEYKWDLTRRRGNAWPSPLPIYKRELPLAIAELLVDRLIHLPHYIPSLPDRLANLLDRLSDFP